MNGSLCIDGRWRDGGGPAFASVSPSDGRTAWRGRAADAADTDAAVRSARRAFPDWAGRPPETRIASARAFAARLKENAEGLAALIGHETGKPLWEARAEVGAMVGKVELSIRAQAERAGERRAPLPDGGESLLTHRPHGVLAVFGPYNFPGHLPNGHIVPALLAGNAVVFKPSELTPGVAAATVAHWLAAGLPPGVLNLLQGGRDTGAALAAHPGIDGLLFTGSHATGAALHRGFAGQTGKLLALEMGGNNPLVVQDAADPDAAALIVVLSAFMSAGQRCTCARRLLLARGAAGDAVLERVLALTDGLRIGRHDDEPAPFMGPLISTAAADAVLAAQERLLSLGGRALRRARRQGPTDAFLRPGIVDVTGLRDLPDEEVFGPLLQVIRTESVDEAIGLANATRFGLAAGLVSEDPALWERFRLESRAGIVNRNRPTTGASSAAPFGGTGDSGNLRPSAWYAADYCAHPVASMGTESVRRPADLPPGLEAAA